MAVRLQLLQDVYMNLDGQWGVVLSGTIFDAPSQASFSAAHAQIYAGVPASVSTPTTAVQPPRRR